MVRNSDDLAESSGSDVLPDEVDPYFNFCVQFARAHADGVRHWPRAGARGRWCAGGASCRRGRAARPGGLPQGGVGVSEERAADWRPCSTHRIASALRVASRREFMTLRETIHEIVVTHERALGWLSVPQSSGSHRGQSDPWGKPHSVCVHRPRRVRAGPATMGGRRDEDHRVSHEPFGRVEWRAAALCGTQS